VGKKRFIGLASVENTSKGRNGPARKKTADFVRLGGTMPTDMRKSLGGVVAVILMLVAGEAHAQFANRSLGASIGFIKLFGGANNSVAGSTNVDFAVPLTIDGTLYIENGFDIYAHIPLMLVSVSFGANTLSGAGLVFGTGGHLGVRYLFSEEDFRPYIGIEVAGFVLLAKTNVVFIGPGAVAGFDYFALDTVSIGVRGFFDAFIELNVPIRPAAGGAVNVAVYF
jgi:outer membrane protein